MLLRFRFYILFYKLSYSVWSFPKTITIVSAYAFYVCLAIKSFSAFIYVFAAFEHIDNVGLFVIDWKFEPVQKYA